jgi:hypothetical protein
MTIIVACIVTAGLIWLAIDQLFSFLEDKPMPLIAETAICLAIALLICGAWDTITK